MVCAIFMVLIGCSVNAILSTKRGKKRIKLSYILEIVVALINLAFMNVIEKGYIDYGDDKFSGLNKVGDWVGFVILLIITCVVIAITIICHVICVVQQRRSEDISQND